MYISVCVHMCVCAFTCFKCVPYFAGMEETFSMFLSQEENTSPQELAQHEVDMMLPARDRNSSTDSTNDP